MTGRRVLPVGDRALLLEADGLDTVLGLADALRRAPLAGQVECVPAARTVLVRFASRVAALHAREALAGLTPGGAGQWGDPDAAREAPADVVLDVVYDGPDLADVSAAVGVSIESLVAQHSATTWRAAFAGFAPGFVYLAGSPWDVPRRSVPRTEVPAGAVGLAGAFGGVYPRSSPGGWQLVGRTGAVLWDPHRDVPALVRPGDTVRFRPVRSSAAGGPRTEPVAGGRPPGAQVGSRTDERATRALAVLEPGPLSLVEDLGRPGQAGVGVSRSGAADRGAAARANRLVGNPRGAAVVETLGGLVLAARGDQVVAVAGARAVLELRPPDGDDPRVARSGRPFALPDGWRLTVARPRAGVRVYVAVRGGVDVPAVLGSRSTDVLGRVGPDPLAAGDVLAVGAPTGVVGAPDDGPPPGHEVTVRAVLGPRDDWFADPDGLFTHAWSVDPRSDRVGVRLMGEPLGRVRQGELASEGMVPGAVQVPPSGQPVVLLADHPVTGGYPVVAVVLEEDLDLLAQAAPGTTVRLVPAR